MRKILLILCIAFVVLCYGFPCIILPFGEYKGKSDVGDYEISYKFSFNGKVKFSADDDSDYYYYRVKGNNIIISEDKTFNKDDDKIAINSFYELDTSLVGQDAKNQVAFWSTLGVGVVALLLIVTIPSKKGDK